MWLFRSGIVLLLYTGMGIYTGIRVFRLLKFFLPFSRVFVFWPLYMTFCFSYILIFLLRLDRTPFLRQVAMYSLPALVYFFLALLVSDGVRLVSRLLNKTPFPPGLTAAATGIALCLSVLVMIYGALHARDIGTVHYTITLNKSLPGHPESGVRPGPEVPLRLALISDLHIGRTVDRKWIARAVDLVNLAEPVIICIAGDIFDNDIGSIRDLEGVAEELRRLNAPLGVYACPGNHDVDRLSFREGASADRIQEFLKDAGIIYLQDEVTLVADLFYLAGRKDARPIGIMGGRKSAAELAADLDKSRPLFFLDHQPVDFPRVEEAGADLILSGHTHKGQFFPGNIATARIFRDAGAVHHGHWQGRFAQAVVTSGVGVWGPPIRIATRSEVAVIDITFGE